MSDNIELTKRNAETNIINSNDQKNIESLVTKASKLISKWTNKEAGDFSMWVDLIKPIAIIVKEQSDNTQIDSIKLAIDIIQRLAKKYYDEHKNKLDDGVRKVLDFVMSDNGSFILSTSTSLIGKLLDEIDTNNDGQISGDECKNFFLKFCCCCIPSLQEQANTSNKN